MPLQNLSPALQALLELANHYPSPHNGQPISLLQTGDKTFDLYFERSRGLQAAEISYLFSYVTMGVFVQHFELAAQALGHQVQVDLALPQLRTIGGEGLIKFGSLKVETDTRPPDPNVEKALLFRQTSRKKYSQGLDQKVSETAVSIASAMNMELVQMDRNGTHQAIWLNQRAVFDDMFDEPVRHELDHWLRYDQAHKEAARDGLSYDCMELNGVVMKWIVNHHSVLHAPGISWILRKYYLRTMTDNSDAFYMLTPFSTEHEAYNVGIAIMKIWYEIAAAGYYLHPFGTIMSNEAAHHDFLKLVGISHEDRSQNFLVFIFRAGKSDKPHASLRLPVEGHLLQSNGETEHV